LNLLNDEWLKRLKRIEDSKKRLNLLLEKDPNNVEAMTKLAKTLSEEANHNVEVTIDLVKTRLEEDGDSRDWNPTKNYKIISKNISNHS